jgi:hypothetical protein
MSLESCAVAPADALLEIGTAAISGVLSVDEHLSHTFLCREIKKSVAVLLSNSVPRSQDTHC